MLPPPSTLRPPTNADQGAPIVPPRPRDRPPNSNTMIPVSGAAPSMQRRSAAQGQGPTAQIPGAPPVPPRQGKSIFTGAANVPIAETAPSMIPRPPGGPAGQRTSVYSDDDDDMPQQGFPQNRDAKRVAVLERMDLPVYPDKNFTSSKVFSLNSTNFTKFLNRMDVTLVVFYKCGSPEMAEIEPIISQVRYHKYQLTFNLQHCFLNSSYSLCSKNRPKTLHRYQSVVLFTFFIHASTCRHTPTLSNTFSTQSGSSLK